MQHMSQLMMSQGSILLFTQQGQCQYNKNNFFDLHAIVVSYITLQQFVENETELKTWVQREEKLLRLNVLIVTDIFNCS